VNSKNRPKMSREFESE